MRLRQNKKDASESRPEVPRADSDVLQKRETTPTVTKRRCGGTTAKLMICVGMKTPLRPALRVSIVPIRPRIEGGAPVADECGRVGLLYPFLRVAHALALEERHGAEEHAHNHCGARGNQRLRVRCEEGNAYLA